MEKQATSRARAATDNLAPGEVPASVTDFSHLRSVDTRRSAQAVRFSMNADPESRSRLPQRHRSTRSATNATVHTGRSSRTVASQASVISFGDALRHAGTYVSPAYADMNPEYEKPSNSRPIWSFAKPFPRAVRRGMLARKSNQATELQRPALRPGDLEQGPMPQIPNLVKLSSQLNDLQTARESQALEGVARRSTLGSLHSLDRSRISGVPLSIVEPNFTIGHPDEASKANENEAFPEHLEATPSNNKDLNGSSMFISGRCSTPLDSASFAGDTPELEILNNHTIWSAFRSRHRECLAEFLATFLQLILGFCANIMSTVKLRDNANITTAWAWACATIAAIHLAGGISGAHLNPALTVMLWLFRGFPKRKIPKYVFAQLLGSFLAAFMAWWLYRPSLKSFFDEHPSTEQSEQDVVSIFVTSRREGYVDGGTAFLNELVGTAMLTCVVLALGDDQNVPPGVGMNPQIIGLVIAGLSFSLTYQTGLALNPARDLGPRLAILALGFGVKLFTDPYWLYGPLAGPMVGALMGALIYDVFIFTGGESPINYPWSRTSRACQEKKAQWKQRLHLRRQSGADDVE